MYCNSCGSMINEGQSFCPNCGAPVNKPVQPAPQPAVQQYQPAQPVYQQPVQQVPAVAPAAPVKASRGFAIGSLILGINTVEFCFIVFVNLFSIITGLAGIILSILGLTRKNGKLKGLAVIGLILSVFGLLCASLMWLSMWSDDASKLFDILFGWIF